MPAVQSRRRRLLKGYYQLESEAQTDPLDPDSPAFDVKACYTQMASTLSIPDLLKRQTDLAINIRELDSERQALVYNHHHELIEASDTIRKMSARAASLDSALDGLAVGLESISQLSASTTSPMTFSVSETAGTDGIDPLKYLPTILSLPARLRSMLNDNSGGNRSGKDEAHLLWGKWVEILRTWEDEGVIGAADIANECREILVGARRTNQADVR